MAEIGKAFDLALPFLRQLPPGTHFDTLGDNDLRFQAPTQADVERIRELFPAVWKRTWSKPVRWWEYTCEYAGLKVEIYAVRENPPQCKAITEKRTVTKRTPTVWVEEEVEQEVIVGWDCGNGAEAKEA